MANVKPPEGRATKPKPGSKKSNWRLLMLLQQQVTKCSQMVQDISTVVTEMVAVTQILLDKGVITRDEIHQKRITLLHPHPVLGERVGIQSQETGPNDHSVGGEQPGVSGAEDDGGDTNCEEDKIRVGLVDGTIQSSPADGDQTPTPSQS